MQGTRLEKLVLDAPVRVASVIREQSEQRRVVPSVVTAAEKALLHTLTLEAEPLEHALRRDVADPHVRLDPVDARRERVLDRTPHDTRGHAAPARSDEEPVADLDGVAQRIEVVKRQPAEELLRVRVLDDIRQTGDRAP